MNNDIKKLNSNDSEKIYKSIIKNIRQSNAEVLIFSENNYPYLVKNLNDLGLNSFLKHNLCTLFFPPLYLPSPHIFYSSMFPIYYYM